ncbi:hypothetical protein NEOLEDRAFT_1140627 [Neolentinus lepideus HHB14362 ss-1]|uniref:Uncharacterized protein n=1 Tax=Neolentinus lepideus HHB14362 ss-1 TaxID=1314782 RepID=A0A165P4S2_9AGAM|nr:hypothetical protein NEOLEDRAFT_1140627 [Neolentinus lepideus HHB14362 ss-1]
MPRKARTATSVTQITPPRPDHGPWYWYHQPFATISRETLVEVVRRFYFVQQMAATTVQNMGIPVAELEQMYNQKVQEWMTTGYQYPTGVSDDGWRHKFYGRVEEIINRENSDPREYMDVFFACDTALQHIFSRDMSQYRGKPGKITVAAEGSEKALQDWYDAQGRSRPSVSESTLGTIPNTGLARLREVVGSEIYYESVQYKIHACLTASEDVTPVYELRYGPGWKQQKWVPLEELEKMIGKIIL